VKLPAQSESKRYPKVFNLTAAETLSLLGRIDSAEVEFSDATQWQLRKRVAATENLTSFLGSVAPSGADKFDDAMSAVETHAKDHRQFREWLSTLNPIARRVVEGYAQALSKAIIRGAHQGRSCKAVAIAEFLSSPGKIANDEMTNAIEKGVFFKILDYWRALIMGTDLFGEPKLKLDDTKRLRSAYRKREELPDPTRPANDPVNLRRKPVTLRCSEQLKVAIDRAVMGDHKTRNDWLNEAIEEKLLRTHPDLLLGS